MDYPLGLSFIGHKTGWIYRPKENIQNLLSLEESGSEINSIPSKRISPIAPLLFFWRSISVIWDFGGILQSRVSCQETNKVIVGRYAFAP